MRSGAGSRNTTVRQPPSLALVTTLVFCGSTSPAARARIDCDRSTGISGSRSSIRTIGRFFTRSTRRPAKTARSSNSCDGGSSAGYRGAGSRLARLARATRQAHHPRSVAQHIHVFVTPLDAAVDCLDDHVTAVSRPEHASGAFRRRLRPMQRTRPTGAISAHNPRPIDQSKLDLINRKCHHSTRRTAPLTTPTTSCPLHLIHKHRKRDASIKSRACPAVSRARRSPRRSTFGATLS